MPKPKPRSHLEIDEEKAKEEATKLRIQFSALLNKHSEISHGSGPSDSSSSANDRHDWIIGDHKQAVSTVDQGRMHGKIFTLELVQRGHMEYTNVKHTEKLGDEPSGSLTDRSEPEDSEVAEQDSSFAVDNEEESIENIEEGEIMDHSPDMPIEIQGIRVVTAELVNRALSTYNAEAVAWIEQNTNKITSSGRQAAEAAYPWIVKTLASYPSPFRSTSDGHLDSDKNNSFPRSLLSRSNGSDSKFKDLHAIVFSQNPKIASAYVEAAQQGSSYITSQQIAKTLSPLLPKPGLYGFCFVSTASTTLDAVSMSSAESVTTPHRLHKESTALFEPPRPVLMNGAKERSSSLTMMKSRNQSFQQLKLRSLHATGALCPPKLSVPRPRIPDEELSGIYFKYKSGEALESIAIAHNLEKYCLENLLTRQPSLKQLLAGSNTMTSEYMTIQKLRISDPIDPPTVNRTYSLPYYPRIPSLNIHLSPGEVPGPLAARAINENWKLLDFALERSHHEAMIHTLEFPVADYRRQAEEDYKQAFAGYRIGQ